MALHWALECNRLITTSRCANLLGMSDNAPEILELAKREYGENCELGQATEWSYIVLLRPLIGLKEEKCNAVACSFITAAAWVRRLPVVLLKFIVLTLYLQKGHLNSVPPFIGLVV
jgi:hypothetical protein